MVQRWLRWARRDDDLPRALIRFAACQKLAGDAKAHVEALARLAQEFPDRPEGAEARRELLLIDTARPKPGSGQ